MITSPTSGLGEIDASQLFAGFDSPNFAASLENGIGGAIGGFLASQLVPATNQDGAIGGSIGSTVGAWLGTFIPIPFLGTFIGSFLGDLFGSLLGDLFGGDSGPPWAQISLGGVGGTFGATQFAADNGGNYQTLQPMETDINAVANQFVALTGGQVTGLGGTGSETLHQDSSGLYVTLPTAASDYYSAAGGGWATFSNEAIMGLLQNMRLAGGDPILTAALAASVQQDSNMSAVAADMQVAKDYQTYTENTEEINILMALNPDSSFAAGWQLTLLRAQELGINQIHEEPGWTATLDPGTVVANPTWSGRSVGRISRVGPRIARTDRRNPPRRRATPRHGGLRCEIGPCWPNLTTNPPYALRIYYSKHVAISSQPFRNYRNSRSWRRNA
jgi:hypothetical protein